MEVEDLKLLLNKVVETKKECDEILDEMIMAASTLEEYEYILSIDGIGPKKGNKYLRCLLF